MFVVKFKLIFKIILLNKQIKVIQNLHIENTNIHIPIIFLFRPHNISRIIIL